MRHVLIICYDVDSGVRNLSKTKDLVWLYVFAADDFDEVQYHFRDDRKVSYEESNAAVEPRL